MPISIRRWVLPTALLILCGFWWPGFANGNIPKWFVLYSLAPILILLGRIEFDALTVSVGFLVAYVLLSLVWTDDWRAGVMQVQKLLALVCVFFYSRAYGLSNGSRNDRTQTGARQIAALALAALLAAVYVFPFHGGFGNENLAAEAVIALLAVVLYGCTSGSNHRWRLRASYGLAAGAFYYLFFENGSKVEYFVIGAVLFGLCLYKRWWVAAFGLVLTAFIVIFALDPGLARHSLEVRAEIGIPTLRMWLDSPLWGQGFGAFSHEFPRVQGVSWLPVTLHPSYFAGAAHNDYLQFLAELGLIGCLLLGNIVWRLTFTPVVGVILLMGLIGFPLQNPFTGFLLAYLLGSAVSYSPEGRSTPGFRNGRRRGILRSRSTLKTRFRNLRPI